MSAKRLLNCIKADIKFQLKHGFYTVYIVLSVIYIIILGYIPHETQKIVLPLLVYFDPAGLGLFFIGGMVLLEKEQGVLALLYITPLKTEEYIISKVITLGLISTLAGAAISMASYGMSADYALLAGGTFLVSVFYTLIGIIIASKASSVNAYIVKMVPAIVILIIPCLSIIGSSIIGDTLAKIMLFVPSAGGLRMMLGAYSDISAVDIIVSLSGLIIVNILLVKKVYSIFTRKVILNE